MASEETGLELCTVFNSLRSFIVKNKDDKEDKHRSKQGFHLRLKTFSMSTWSAKPEGASPVKCAQHGWENTDVDMLKCVTCKKVLSGKLPTLREIETYKEYVSRLCDSIVKSHHKFCPWLSNPTPDIFFNLSTWDTEEILRNLNERLRSLSAVLDFLPNEIESSTIDMPSIMGKLKHVLDDGSYEVSESSLQLALIGWKRKNDCSSPILECEHCLREVGLWHYDGSPVKNGGEVYSDSFVKHMNGKTQDKVFNASAQHKSWCPWLIKVKDVTNGETNNDVETWQRHLNSILKLDDANGSLNAQFNMQQRLRLIRKKISYCTPEKSPMNAKKPKTTNCQN